MKRYAEYKDSGIAWIGEIPKEWCISRIGFESWVRARLGWKGLKAEEYVDDGYVFLSTPNIKTRQIDFENVNYISRERYDESPEIKIQVGDVLLAKDGSTLGTVNVARNLPREATVNSSVAVITPHKMDSVYLLYLFQSDYLQSIIAMKKGGMGVPHLFQEDIVKFSIPIPQKDEQVTIAAYLDRKTAAIDTIIADKLRLITLLKEKRRAIISEAVTKGLDPSVSMKDSGVEWIGEIPAHWKVKRLKYLANICNGQEYKNFEVEENGIPVYGSGGVFALASKAIHDKPSVLLGRKGTIDKPLYVTPPFWTVDTMYYTDVCNHCDAEFLYYLCTTIRFDYFQYGSAVPSMTQKDLNNIKFPFPSKTEQVKIVVYIKETTATIDTLIANIAAQIEKLKEYRQAIISEAVTGKVEI